MSTEEEENAEIIWDAANASTPPRTLAQATARATELGAGYMRPPGVSDATWIVIVYEWVCNEVRDGIGGANRCGDYGEMRKIIVDLMENK